MIPKTESDSVTDGEQPLGVLTSSILSDLPGVVHGFTARSGGCSTGPLSSLNLSFRVGDDPGNVVSNRASVLQLLGRPDCRWISVKQVHGVGIVQVTCQAGSTIEADGIWTRDRGAALGVLVADCVPIVMADVHCRAIAVVHAGWRGTLGRIAARMVETLGQVGIRPEDLRVALGPAIGPSQFEVGAEVLSSFRQAFDDDGDWAKARGAGSDKALLDLWTLNERVLAESGVPQEAIDSIRLCTVSDERFFSYRRDAGSTGRQAGVVALA